MEQLPQCDHTHKGGGKVLSVLSHSVTVFLVCEESLKSFLTTLKSQEGSIVLEGSVCDEVMDCFDVGICQIIAY